MSEIGTINTKEDYESKLKTANDEINYNKIQDYMNNYDYKISYINIDSRFRNITPQNVVKMFQNYLPSNPISTFKDNYKVRVSINNDNTLAIGDKIILQNIERTPIILNKSIYLISNYNYYMVNMDNHNLQPSYTEFDDFKVQIESYDTLSITDRLIGNIPINSILGLHSIKIYNNDESFLPNVIKNVIINKLNINDTILKENYFFIQLPFNYVNINQINTFIIFPEFNNIDKIFKFIFNNIGGINLYYLNANYPINNYQYQAYHEITNVGENYIEFKSSAISLFSQINGGDNVTIGKVISLIEGYPNINNYTINFKKSFTDVYSLELVSSEFPYIDNNIKSNSYSMNINKINNKLYWKYLEDGDYIYSISLDNGTYYLDSLVLILKTKMNNIERVYSTPENIVYTEFDINYDSNSQEFRFLSYKTDIIPYSLSLEQDLSLGSQVLKLIVKQKGNYVSVGDTITINNATDIGDISSTLINKSHIIYSINIEASSYTIILITNQFLQNINLSGDGGAKTTIRTPVLTSFLFNYSDTIGTLLGFKYVGELTSITPFSHITTNIDNYIYPTIYNEVGERTVSNNYFNFNGMNYYILMYLNDYENIYTTNNFNNAFTKILMKGHPGDILYDTFVKHSPLVFDIPLKTLSELKISYLYPDGTSPDFRNIEHSFTLKIVERLSRPTRTGLNSIKMNYLDSLKDLAFNNNFNLDI
jgi:hypothetical protein